MDRRDSTSAARLSDSIVTSVSPQEPATAGEKSKKRRQPKPINPMLLLKAQGVAIASIITMTLLVVLITATKTTSYISDCLPCEDADEHLQRVADRQMSPCNNFYQHVCGRFTSSLNGSFEDVVIQEGRRRLRDALIVYPSTTQKLSWTFQLLSSYYKSCVEDLRNQNNMSYVSVKYAEATGFSWTLFENISSVPTFLDLIAKMTVEFTLNPGIWIRPSASAFVMGPLELASFLSVVEMRSILVSASASLLRPLTRNDAFEVEALHLRIRQTVERLASSHATTSSNSASAALPQLGLGTAEEWVGAIAKHTARPLNISVSSLASIVMPEVFRYIIKAIYNKAPAIRSIYLYAYVIHEIIRIVNVSIEAAGHIDVVSNVCLDQLEATEFYAMHRAFAVYSLATERTVTSVRDILAHAAYQIIASIRTNRRLQASTKINLAQMLRSYSFVNVFSEPFLDPEQLNSTYEAFPEKITIYHAKLNLRTALQEGTFEEFQRLSSCLKSRSRLLNYEGDLCVSPYVLVPPMYYPDARLSYNFGALGFLMALQTVRAFLLAGPAQDTDAVQTLLYRSTTCHSKARDVSREQEATDLVSCVLGLRSAFDAYSRWRKYSLYETGKDEDYKVVFERACFSVCADTPLNILRGGDAWGSARVCNVAVRSMPEFYSLFRCTVGSQMSRNGICTFF